MIIKRVFHPVGQGAFYREKINQFNFIYDCGAKKCGKDSPLKNEAQNFSKKENQIDLLVISHFDSDHYNGVKFLLENNCLIKKIMIPHLNEEIKLLSIIQRITRETKNSENLMSDLKMIINPVEELKKIMNKDKLQIIQVLPKKYEFDENIEGENIEYSALQDMIISGTCITIEEKNNWIIKPFNLAINITIKSDILLEINNILKLGLNDLDLNITNILKELSIKIEDDTLLKERKIEIVHEELKIVYNNLGLEKNKYSLCCYSGLKNDKGKKKIGCLYTGDYDAKDEIFPLLNFYDKYINYIGIVQIPHHGADENFTDQLMLKNIRIALISAGKNNQYNHPSANVVKDIANHCMVYIINEVNYYEENYIRYKNKWSN
ncbi:MAG: hypothetical protein ACRDAG_12535 [Cetobacterium somerae]|uniref:hypothetical protein n=1 Tax=Cetobacterium somerae TaxID=188913 RepID=UPI003F3CD709